MAETLPDLVAADLEVLFVGINPSLYSVAHGHYFARPTNRFWPAFTRSRLSEAARRGLGLAGLKPEHDRALLAYGFGFTDMVKRATARASDLTPAEFAAAVPRLLAKLEKLRPRFACFHGVTSYRPLHAALGPASEAPPVLGLQPTRIGATRLFLVPNPSPANAHFTPAEQTHWYDALAAL